MTNEQDASRNRRRRQALLRLGTTEPICLFCDQDDPRCLELHHVAGEAYDQKVTAIICRNHHRILSDMQRDHPPGGDDPPDLFETVGRLLLGLADLLEILGPRLRQLGADVLARIRVSNSEGAL